MTIETNKIKARELLEAVDRQQFADWRAGMSPDVIARANGGDPMNADQFEGMARMMTTAFSNSRHIIESQVAEGDWVATRLTWTGLHVGEFNGVPASNRPVSICGAAYDRFENGKVVEHQAHFDAMGLMMQIGAVKAPG